MKIIFICSGNVGRSQIAEGFYNYFTGSHDATSAGCDLTMPAKWSHPAPQAVQVMREKEIDISTKLVKTITEQMVNEAGKIVVLCKRDECPTFLLNHQNISFWEIEDPYQTSIETFREVRDIIQNHVLGLLQGRS